MRRGMMAAVCSALAVAGIAAGMLAGGVFAAPAKTPTTKITVTMSEFKFVFSKRTAPIGTVVFTVVNKGKISHNFKINGKTTKTLSPGQKQTLTVKFTKKGHYAYLCTLVGHAQAGMRGTFSIAVAAVAPPKPTPTTTTTPTTTAAPPTGTVGTAQTTVQVSMFEYGFKLSQSTVPSGQVTFVISNDGQEVHNFDIEGVKVGAMLNAGGKETWTVSLPPRTYTYDCDVAFHAQQGMIGQLTVTP